MAAITLYGIANCDTVRRARAWLGGAGIEFDFHDFKKAGVPLPAFDGWLDAVGWERLLNRQGSTWRKLDERQRVAVQGRDSAAALMLAQPSCIKRPVVQWADGAVSVGFDAEDWARRLKR